MSATRTSFVGRLVAEFSIIVLGVLVALGVDEWRQTLSARAEEEVYYERLAGDLAADIENWELLLGQVDPKEEALLRIGDWLEDPAAADDDSLRRLAQDLAMGAVFSGSVPPPRRSTYEELLSTGKLEVIRDRSYRAQLIEYHFAFENLRLRISSRITGYERLAYALVPREMRGTGDNFARSDLSSAELRSIARRASDYPDLMSFIIAERNRATFLRGQFEQLVIGARDLLERARQGPTESSS